MRKSLLWTAAAGLLGYTALKEMLGRKRYMDLRGKTVLITGGSRGLGLLLVRRFARAGARVALCARDTGELDRVREELAWMGKQLLTLSCDVANREEVEQMIAIVRQELGEIDVLVNNAGIIVTGPFETQSIEEFEQVMQINFWGAVYTSMAVLPTMSGRRSGRIVNITSIGGKIAVPHLLTYSASKFALVGFSEALRMEMAKYGIWVTTVCPGLMRTGSPRNADFKGQHRKEYAWFMVSDSLPGPSISAERAAQRIFRACVHGEPEVILGLPAKVAARFYALAPSLSAEILAATNRMLPEPTAHKAEARKGFESESSVTQSWITGLTREAERANNQLQPNG
jgi:short-subunit dehydrogenase